MVSKDYLEWNRIITEMGIDFNPTKDNAGYGRYRNHYVTINHIAPNIYDGSIPEQLGYEVELKNPWIIVMSLRKRSLLPFGFFSKPKSERMRVVMTGDPEFDRKFIVTGDNERDIRTIIDQDIRKKIMCIKNFNLDISMDNTTVARYADFRTISAKKQEAERLQLILNTMIDIVEKIEAHTPSV